MEYTKVTMIEVIGWIGSICFAVCGLPLAIEVIKKKNADHLNNMAILLWLIGEVFTLIYVIVHKNYPLVFNYLFNLLTLLIIVYYKIKPPS